MRINRGNRILIVIHLNCCSKQYLYLFVNTQFLTLQLSNLRLLLSFSIRKHTSMASLAIL